MILGILAALRLPLLPGGLTLLVYTTGFGCTNSVQLHEPQQFMKLKKCIHFADNQRLVKGDMLETQDSGKLPEVRG
ncbi:hypothetical protein T10_6558 [Trichinella papuae]|uniref:Uncharacterized protein n=1 Tax=Trichinella papuae TaxID=268474 RepID=A0A0V1MRE3_9BILA|nr:hypothetical protein T10_6558 [Trichinella papuae]